MKKRSFRPRLLQGCIAMLLVPATVAAQVVAAAPPVEAFFADNAFHGAMLSPDGRSLAVRMSAEGRRDFLAVIDLQTKTAKNVAEYTQSDIASIRWVNDRRLVYTLRDRQNAPERQDDAPGLFAVDLDGGNRLQLASRGLQRDGVLPYNTMLSDQPGRQDSDWIYVERILYDKDGKYAGGRFWPLNTVTGLVDKSAPLDFRTSSVMLDFQGQPRLAIDQLVSGTSIAYLDPATHQWRHLLDFPAYGDVRAAIKPLGFGPDGTLYVRAYAGDDMATLRTLDLATGKVSKDAVVATPGYDFNGSLIANHDKLLGVHLTTDAESTIWFDAGTQALQNAVNKAMPATINMLSVPVRPGVPWVMVESYSDRQPPVYALYHTDTGLVETIGASYPAISAAAMGRQETVRYQARDGRSIPGLLTLPPGRLRRQLPMVVLVHGGPWLRGASWGWDPEAQFLASRGYAVLQVEFRGSTGFGAAHFEAGFKQWGLAMQDDVADGARWAIAQGIADPQRICIAGSSYGGYATLMGLVNDPALYRCGVEWSGVTDIDSLLTGTWWNKSDLSDAYLRYGAPLLVGDVVNDAVQLRATSPLRQAARITQPLLLAHGSQDERVPINQGRRFRAAVSRTNRQVEWIEYRDEGHGWSQARNRIDFWTRVEQFLFRHIGKPAWAPAPAPPATAVSKP